MYHIIMSGNVGPVPLTASLKCVRLNMFECKIEGDRTYLDCILGLKRQ